MNFHNHYTHSLTETNKSRNPFSNKNLQLLIDDDAGILIEAIFFESIKKTFKI